MSVTHSHFNVVFDDADAPAMTSTTSEQGSQEPPHLLLTDKNPEDLMNQEPPLKLGIPIFIKAQNHRFQITTTAGWEAHLDSNIFEFKVSYLIEDDVRCCCRYQSGKLVKSALGCRFFGRFGKIYEHEKYTPAYEPSEERYLVVGLRSSDNSTPKERVLRVRDDYDMFKKIRSAMREARPMYRRLLSLKSVSSFGIYQCFVSTDDHVPSQLDRESQRALGLFFAAFQSGESAKSGNGWIDWIHNEFNNASVDPAEGKYTLELKLDWSAPKFVFWGIAPILLSFVVGLWYMLKPLEEGADYVTVVQTGWTIASYIVTAAAVLLGILAAITQFGEV